MQGTKPDSLTVAQTDSPAGLAAWVVEKFRTWSDCGGHVESAFSKDTLLTNLMFYWAPNSVAGAARIYFEAGRDPADFRYLKVEVPTGVAVFPAEPWQAPRHWVEPRFNIQRWTQMPRGGHFWRPIALAVALKRPRDLDDCNARAWLRDDRRASAAATLAFNESPPTPPRPSPGSR